ncbi:MAG: HAMP domain-containing histidine kinase [Lewinella sp.]|nr:HAMP domain-containing histidine kinase [Lewinella sp.]
MKNKLPIYLILASGLAIAALIAFQVNWMRHSQELLEEQFQHRVNMALCNTVEQLSREPSCTGRLQSQCLATNSECDRELDTLLRTEVFSQTLARALAFYQIDLPYQANIVDRTALPASLASMAPAFSCSLEPLVPTEDHLLALQFDGRKNYILKRMGAMTGASFGILLLICLIFFFATYHLLRQQRISRHNREFFNQMAHEFRTPLTNIRLASNLLQRKAESSAAAPYLRIIQDASDQLMTQVNTMLHLARFDRREGLDASGPVDAAGLLREAIDNMGPQIEERQTEVLFADHSGGANVVGDALHLRNVFHNLIDNALKHTPAGTPVEVEVATAGREVRITVADHGQGLPAEQLPLLFDPYFRCAPDGEQAGFGLGLAYVKKIVDLHGGRIAVDSKPGQGTRFQLFFPQTPAA